MIAFVTFKWKPKPGYRSTFTSAHVNTTLSMLRRHYSKPFRLVCVTDDAEGLDPAIEVIPLWDHCSGLNNATWPDGPSCYRRLFVFSQQFADMLGAERFVCLDLDMVFTANVDALFDRTEDFVIWKPQSFKIPLCASMFMVKAGACTPVWDRFVPERSPSLAHNAGFRGSDQGWIMYVLGTEVPGWTTEDGVYGFKDHIMKGGRPGLTVTARYRLERPPRTKGQLPPDARVVIFTGKPDPWDAAAQRASPWILEHYK